MNDGGLANEDVGGDGGLAELVLRQTSVRSGVRKRRPRDLQLDNPLPPTGAESRVRSHFHRVSEPANARTRKTPDRASQRPAEPILYTFNIFLVSSKSFYYFKSFAKIY